MDPNDQNSGGQGPVVGNDSGQAPQPPVTDEPQAPVGMPEPGPTPEPEPPAPAPTGSEGELPPPPPVPESGGDQGSPGGGTPAF